MTAEQFLKSEQIDLNQFGTCIATTPQGTRFNVGEMCRMYAGLAHQWRPIAVLDQANPKSLFFLRFWNNTDDKPTPYDFKEVQAYIRGGNYITHFVEFTLPTAP